MQTQASAACPVQPASQSNPEENAPQAQQFQGSIHDSLCNRTLLHVLRLIFFLTLSARLYFLLLINKNLFKVVLYLTNISYVSTLLFFSLALLDLLLSQLCCQLLSPRLKDVVALVFEVSICLEVPVTLFYWGDGARQPSAWEYAKDVGIHGFPLFCLLVDFSLNLVPFPTKHILLILSAGVLYMLYNLTYSLSVQAPYANINWRTGMSYVWVLVAFLLIAAAHLLAQLLWFKCKKKYFQQKMKGPNQPTLQMIEGGAFGASNAERTNS